MQAVTRKELAGVIAEKTMSVKDPAELARAIAAYIVGSPKSVDINSLTRDVMQYRLDHGYVEAVAYSAHELPGTVLDEITVLLNDQYPAATHIHVVPKIDENVVGGVRIELPNETLDLSIRSKLNTFKRLLSEERN